MLMTISKAMMKRKNKKRKGFTLVELVIVVAIIGIIAAIAIPQFTSMTLKANASSLDGTHQAIVSAINLHVSEKGTLPTSEGGLAGYLEGVTSLMSAAEFGQLMNAKPEGSTYVLDFSVTNQVTVTSTLPGAVAAGLKTASRVGNAGGTSDADYVITTTLTI